MEYTKVEAIAKVDAFLTPENVCNLYAQDFLNYTGTVTDGNEKYTEVMAARILERIDMLKNHIAVIVRERSYNANHEQIEYDPADGERREEERRARAMSRLVSVSK